MGANTDGENNASVLRSKFSTPSIKTIDQHTCNVALIFLNAALTKLFDLNYLWIIIN